MDIMHACIVVPELVLKITFTTHNPFVNITYHFTNVEGMQFNSNGMVRLLITVEPKQITNMLSRLKQHDKQMSHYT